MYPTRYYVNVQTGELRRVSQPNDSTLDEYGFIQIQEHEYNLYKLVASYAIRDYKIQDNETGFYNDPK